MNREAYRFLLSTYGRRPGIWFAVFTEIVRSLIMRVYIVVLLAQATSDVIKGDIGSAKHRLVLYVIYSLFASVFASVGELVSQKSENAEYCLQINDYYSKITNKDMSFYRDNHTGYLSSTYMQHLDVAILLVRFLRSEVLRTFISLTIPVIVLIYISVPVGLIATAIVLSQAIYIYWASKKADKYRTLAHESHRRLAGLVADDITNIVAYKSASKEKSSSKKIMNEAKTILKAFWLRRKTTIFLDFPRNILTTILTGAAFYAVVNTKQSTAQSASMLVLTLTYVFQLIRNIVDIPDIINKHDDFITKIVPTLEVLTDEHETIRDIKNPTKLNVTNGAISIKNLHFSYNENRVNQKVFNGLSVEIKGGEKIGIVGLSGAGKSTLANLLMRFDEAQSGSIEIDGIDIKTVRQSDLRDAIAYVPQEPLLFHTTIRENIAYSRDNSSDDQITKSAKASHAHEFIKKLEHGYDTIVGERGIKLSGGQKQRIVIARAILKDAPIIIMDEATSALDSESEQIIQRALPEIIGRHTAIVIAHRLSTLSKMDRIIVMHGGKIEESGTHAELINLKGRYFGLWQKQVGN